MTFENEAEVKDEVVALIFSCVFDQHWKAQDLICSLLPCRGGGVGGFPGGCSGRVTRADRRRAGSVVWGNGGSAGGGRTGMARRVDVDSTTCYGSYKSTTEGSFGDEVFGESGEVE